MATAPLANPMPPFDPDSEIGANIGHKWKVWLEDFEMYITANGIPDKKQKRAFLLYQAGSRVREIFRQLPDRGEDDDYDTAVTKLNGYFEPQKYVCTKFTNFPKLVKEVLKHWTNITPGYEACLLAVNSPIQTLKSLFKSYYVDLLLA